MRLAPVRAAALALVLASAPPPATAHPAADLEPGDRLEAELRVLDLADPAGRGRLLPMTALGTRPLRRGGWLPDSGATPTPLAALSWRRIERELGRDRDGGPSGDTVPYLWRLDDGADTRFELSATLDGRWDANRDTARFANASGLHLRAALGIERWILQTRWVVGQVDSARRFADPLLHDRDLLAQPEQALLGYRAPGDRWSVRFGRGRWHWGPGAEGSLMLSRTAPPITALELQATLARGRLRLTTLSATLRGAEGEQLAGHRVEWQPCDGLRLGASESARYQSSGWRPLYAIGLLPYTSVQRLDDQDEPGAVPAHRNNVMASFDAAWRVAPGTRVYGELLLDDVSSHTGDNPDKLAFQLGWEGVGSAMGRRVRWIGEYTRLSRHVYTSFFGREYSVQGAALGFPTGPDARRLWLGIACDPSTDWELRLDVSRTEKGENDLGEPFVPGSPRAPIWSLSGVPERTRIAEGALRWWPSGSVDVTVRAGYEWAEDLGHVAGRDLSGARGSIEVRLGR